MKSIKDENNGYLRWEHEGNKLQPKLLSSPSLITNVKLFVLHVVSVCHVSFPNLISSLQTDTWPWIMHRRAFLPNDWTMFYLKWGQKAPRLWQGCFGGNQTLVFCAVAETEALMRLVGQMVGAGGSTLAPLCAGAGCRAQAADPTRLRCTHRVWPGGCSQTPAQTLVQSRCACGCQACMNYIHRWTKTRDLCAQRKAEHRLYTRAFTPAESKL